jgi:hypothetical protein
MFVATGIVDRVDSFNVNWEQYSVSAVCSSFVAWLAVDRLSRCRTKIPSTKIHISPPIISPNDTAVTRFLAAASFFVPCGSSRRTQIGSSMSKFRADVASTSRTGWRSALITQKTKKTWGVRGRGNSTLLYPDGFGEESGTVLAFNAEGQRKFSSQLAE